MRIFLPGVMLIASIPSQFRMGLILSLASVCFVFTRFELVQNKVFITFFLMLFLLYISLSLVHLSRQRLSTINAHIKDLSQLSAIQLTSNDVDFNLVATQINQLIRQIERKSNLIENCASEAKYTASELANASTQLALDANQEHITLNSITSTADEMNTSVSHIAKHIEETKQLAQHTQDASNQGAKAVNSLNHSLLKLNDEISINQHNITKLSHDTDNIKNFVSNISDINEQINLLALNAAIESARAGNAGRGFSVVANEIRLLASRTHQVSLEIVTLISQVQAQVERSYLTSQNINQHNLASKKAAKATLQALERIQKAATSTHTAVHSANASITDFSKGNEDLCQRLQDIANLSEKNSLSSKETNEMVTYLTWLSNKLESHKE